MSQRRGRLLPHAAASRAALCRPLPPPPLQIAKSLAGGGMRMGRLYLTDGSMPDYEATGYPRDAPG